MIGISIEQKGTGQKVQKFSRFGREKSLGRTCDKKGEEFSPREGEMCINFYCL